jgi:hypothetical protein
MPGNRGIEPGIELVPIAMANPLGTRANTMRSASVHCPCRVSKCKRIVPGAGVIAPEVQKRRATELVVNFQSAHVQVWPRSIDHASCDLSALQAHR